MRKFLTVLVLFVAFTATAQEQFSKVFNAIAVYHPDTQEEVEEAALTTLTFNYEGKNAIRVDLEDTSFVVVGINGVVEAEDDFGFQFQYGEYKDTDGNVWKVHIYSNLIIFGLVGKVGIGFFNRGQ